MLNLTEQTTDDMIRIPGLFRRWELAELILPGQSLHIEGAGEADDGTPLFAVYRTAPNDTGGAE